MVTRGSAVTVPERDRERVTARQLMVPAETLEPASPEDDGASLLQRLEGEGLVAVPVVSGGEVLGLVGRAGLLHLLERRGRR
jgi:CBS-domain-containing membrane protein